MDQNNNEDSPEIQKTFYINFNLSKINLTLVVTCIILSIFKAQYEYIRAVYDSLLTILIYNNIVFIYLLYINRKSL